MAAIHLVINNSPHEVEIAPDTPLLWVLRDKLNLTGTKYGCGMGLCGACTVHLDGEAVRACQTPVSSVGTKKITTIEGLSADNTHPVQRAWIAEQVPQCGYCQTGQIMSAAALLAKTPKPSDDQIEAAMVGNLCRCGMYQRIRSAIHRASSYAYQIKFRTGRLALTWRELSTFIGLADSPHIHSRVLLTNCDELPAVLNSPARKGFFCIRGSDLDRLEASDFRAIEAWLADAAYIAPKKSPQPHQTEALDALLPALQTHDRVSAIMACGTGKTIVALWTMEKLVEAFGSREATDRKLASHEVAGNAPANFPRPEGTLDFHRPFRTDSVWPVNQTLRVWLISNVPLGQMLVARFSSCCPPSRCCARPCTNGCAKLICRISPISASAPTRP